MLCTAERLFATDVAGHLSIFKNETLLFKIEPIRCPETSLENYHSTLRIILEERTSLLNCSGSLNPRIGSSYQLLKKRASVIKMKAENSIQYYLSVRDTPPKNLLI